MRTRQLCIIRDANTPQTNILEIEEGHLRRFSRSQISKLRGPLKHLSLYSIQVIKQSKLYKSSKIHRKTLCKLIKEKNLEQRGNHIQITSVFKINQCNDIMKI